MCINGLQYPINQINGQRITGPPIGFEHREPAHEDLEARQWFFN